MITGIDISRHQGAVNLDAIKNDKNISFVIVRAGYGGGSDDQLIRNRDGLRARGVPLGFYFFAYPGRSSGRTQAEEFAKAVGPLQPGEFVALDIENEPVYGRNLIPSDVQWCVEFLDRATELFGCKPMIYMDGGVKAKFDWNPVQDKDYGLWAAHWGSNNGQVTSDPNPAPWEFWALHQYTSKANMGGISPVDANRFNGTIDQLKKYGAAGGTVPTPPPNPTPAPKPPVTYTVQKGDTLSGIAAKYGMSWQQLYEQNKAVIGPDPNKIYPGQVLTISGGSGGVPAHQYYTVQRGDSLSSIATKYGTTWQQLYEWNKGVIGPDPNKIYPGQKLRVK